MTEWGIRSLSSAGVAPGAVESRFWSKVRIAGPDECWLWIAGLRGKGYGCFRVGSRTDNSACKLASHRCAWELTHGPVPDGLFVLHRCDRPSCCNPRHLWLGTHMDNMADMRSKQRGVGKTAGEINGNARLTVDVIRQMRALHPGLSYEAIARRFGVWGTTAENIIKRKTWKHVL
jgi:hypothetical protein